MTISRIIASVGYLAFAISAQISPANAQSLGDLLGPVETVPADATANWRVSMRRRMAIDTADIGNSTDQYSYTVIITATAPDDSVAVDLGCRVSTTGYSSLLTAIQLNPSKHIGGEPSEVPPRKASGRLIVGDNSKMERWFYIGEKERLSPINQGVAARIFNGAVRGDDLTIKTRGKSYTLQLPAQNDTFKQFAKFCPKTNGNKPIDPDVFKGWTDMLLPKGSADTI